jgi:hypothetical protein
MVPMGLGFRVARGVRLYSGGRGLGASVGTGRVRYYRYLTGGRPSGAGRRTSVSSHQRQARAAARAQEIERVAQLDLQLAELCEAHRHDFEPARRPVAPSPALVDRDELERSLVADAVGGIPLWKLGKRRAARRAVAARLDEAVEAAQRVRAHEAQALRLALDAEWERLQANDPETVLATLEDAFEDNEAPAAAVSCHEARVDVVMRWPGVEEIVSERKPATTPTGKPTVHKRNKTERATLYLQAMSSHALVTAKEAFATCPAIEEVAIAVVREARDPARGDDVLEPILLATLRREQLEGIRWQNTVSTAALLETATGRIGLRGKGANKTLFALDLGDAHDEREFISEVAEQLEARVPDGGVSGLALPITVAIG